MNAVREIKKVKAKHKIKFWNIAVGDNVRIITGPHKGKIGRVQDCIKDQNKVKKMLPLFLSQQAGLESQKFEYAAPIHYSNVQLVGELPSTDLKGLKRSVIVKRVNRGKMFYNKDKKLLTWRRWIPGENLFLPWPRNERPITEGPSDTIEADVKASTFLETLHQAPLPLTLENELRTKYSKFRRSSKKASVASEFDEGHPVDDSLETPSPDSDFASNITSAANKRHSALDKLTPATVDILAKALETLNVKGIRV